VSRLIDAVTRNINNVYLLATHEELETITNEGDEQLHGGFWFIGYDGLEYVANGGMSARRQAIVDGLQARDIRRPNGRL
jgi:hypothetical protein